MISVAANRRVPKITLLSGFATDTNASSYNHTGVTFSNTPQLLIACAAFLFPQRTGTITPPSISDSAGHGWTLVRQLDLSSARSKGQWSIYMFAAPNSVESATFTVTYTFTGTGLVSLVAGVSEGLNASLSTLQHFVQIVTTGAAPTPTTSLSLSMSPKQRSGNRSFAFVFHEDNEGFTITNASLFQTLDAGSGDPGRGLIATTLGDFVSTFNASWPTSGIYGGILCELNSK